MPWFKKQNKQSDNSPIEPEVLDMMGLPPDEALPSIGDEEQKLPNISDKPEDAETNEKVDTEKNHDDNDGVTNDTSSPETEAAVKDIIANESDKLLESEDSRAPIPPQKKENKLKKLFKAWWNNKILRTLTIILLFFSLMAVALVPQSRYFVLNTAGVKASMSITVIDEKSGRPIKNVEVAAGGQSTQTDKDGKAVLRGLALGKTTMILEKRSFATIRIPITVGWGSNPYESPFQLEPTGESYEFKFTDWLSGQSIEKAEVTDGESTAISVSNGIAELTIEPQTDELDLTFKASGYRTEKIKLDVGKKGLTAVKLVAAKPSVFISKRSGKYDLYKKDVDGKNEAVIFAASGNEQSNLSLLPHTSDNITAFVSTREGKRNKDGYLLSNLYIVDVASKTATKVKDTEAEKIQLIDWIGDRLIFVKIVSGPSGNYASRQKILSFDYKQESLSELAAANYFNDVEVVKEQIFFAPSATKKLTKTDAEGKSQETIVSKEVWTIYRSSYNNIIISTAENNWLEYSLSNSKVSTMSGEPPSLANKIYIDSPSKNKSAWVDNRDGKGVLIVYDIKSGKDKILKTASGLQYPLRWLTDKHILFRISNIQETADYVLNIEGGEAKKVNDTNSTELTNRWYYY